MPGGPGSLPAPHAGRTMRARPVLLLLSLAAALACSRSEGDSSGPAGRPPADASAPGPDGRPVFRDITATSGVDFVHRNGRTLARLMPETMGSGVAILDADGDGLMDLYFVDSGPVPGAGGGGSAPANRLYRNLGGLRFQDVTEKAGVAGRGFGMGAFAADYDGDGATDIYVTCLGPNILSRNRGDGTFEDVTARTGADDPRWSTGAVFLDFDADGHLDLFVQNYVRWEASRDVPCFHKGVRIYCTPDVYEGTPASLFRNRGDGTFEDVSTPSGIAAHAGKGLAVLASDLDLDGRPEIYCANDLLRNFLFRTADGRTFEEIGVPSGAAFGEDGGEEAGMGVDASDIDGDDRPEIVVSNFQGETNAIYRNEGDLAFTEISRITGTAETSLNRLAFGLRFLDYDNDGVEDLVVANGHIYDNVAEIDAAQSWAQPPTLFRGAGGGRFFDVTDASGAFFARPRVARGLAAGDLDDDGDPDLVLTQNGGQAVLFENVGGNTKSWIGVVLRPGRDRRNAIGARVTVETPRGPRTREVRAGGSYLSTGDPRLLFGLDGAVEAARVTIRWPDGLTETAERVPARRYVTATRGEGVR